MPGSGNAQYKAPDEMFFMVFEVSLSRCAGRDRV